MAMKHCALPIWDKIVELESSGKVPDDWKKYAEVWPKIATEKGHLSDEGFTIAGAYRTIIAKKPA